MQNSAVQVDDVRDPAYRPVEVWNRFVSRKTAPACVTILKAEHSSAVYRLQGAGRGGECVIAKRSPADEALIEQTVYRDVLAHLPLPALECYGCCPDDDNPEYAWLFLEDAGDESYKPEDPRHRVLLSRWLATTHICASRISAAAELPDRGPRHYFELLKSAIARVTLGLANPALQTGDIRMLRAIVTKLERIASGWEQLEMFCDRAPKTLVHGDFASKNARVRTRNSELILYPLDWATAGWAVIAADLDQQIDLSIYCSITREVWPQLHLDDLRCLAVYGRIFQVLAGIDWAAISLSYEWIQRPMAYLSAYDEYLRDFLQTAGWEN